MVKRYDKHGYAQRATILLEAGKHAISQEVVNTEPSAVSKPQSMKRQGLKIFNQLIMPSMAEFKQLATQGEQKQLLREIKSATIEKLTNKILRSFA